MRRMLGVAVVMAALLSLTVAGASAHHRDGHASAAGGVSGPAFYVDGALYRTVGTPTSLPVNGNNEHSFDTIYDIPGVPNVADAAPGDRDFNGGRWMVTQVVIEVELGDGENLNDYLLAMYGDVDGITSDAELFYYEGLGVVDVTDTILTTFECPVIPLPGGPNH